MIGTLNGLVFLPVLLSLAGPGPEVGIPSELTSGSELVLSGRMVETEDFSLIPQSTSCRSQMQILDGVILLVPLLP